MHTWRHLLLFCGLLSLAGLACQGGSGSSGFDIHSENAAIQQALSEQRCVQHESLSICPAAQAGVTPSPTPTLPPTSTVAPAHPTSTPAGNTSTPGSAPTATPTSASTAVAATATATATATLMPSPGAERVDIGINPAAAVPCTPEQNGDCAFVLPIAASGFASDATFRVAVRTLSPAGPWVVGGALLASGTANPAFDVPVTLSAAPSNSASAPITAQAAVLVFSNGSANTPATVTELVDSGADAAFVTAPFLLQPR